LALTIALTLPRSFVCDSQCGVAFTGSTAASYVRVSNNQLQWSPLSSSSVFTYVLGSSLTAMLPLSGAAFYSHTVSLYGQNFLSPHDISKRQENTLLCRFEQTRSRRSSSSSSSSSSSGSAAYSSVSVSFAPAVHINSTLVTCQLPPGVGEVRVYLSYQHSSSVYVPVLLQSNSSSPAKLQYPSAEASVTDHIVFTFITPAHLLSFTPALGAIDGSTNVLVTLQPGSTLDFLNRPIATTTTPTPTPTVSSDDDDDDDADAEAAEVASQLPLPTSLYCRFGNVTVSGTIVNATTARCQAPPLPYPISSVEIAASRRLLGVVAGSSLTLTANTVLVGVELSTDGTFASVPSASSSTSTTGHVFVYHDPITVTGVLPSGLVGVSSTIYVQGSNFINSDFLTCRLSSVILVPGVWLSSSLVMCKSSFLSPSDPQFQSVVSANGANNNAGGTPQFLVEVSNNRQDFVGFNETVDVTALSRVTVTGFAPTQGPIDGGTYIIISGSNFFNVSTIVCRFNNQTTVKAVFLNSTQVACTSPEHTVRLPAKVTIQRFRFQCRAAVFACCVQLLSGCTCGVGIAIDWPRVRWDYTHYYRSTLPVIGERRWYYWFNCYH
jgi:hypothetical protein